MIQSALDRFKTWTGNTPSWAWWVPGRIEVFGKHTDYAGGRSLVAAVPRGIVSVGAPRPDPRVRVLDANRDVLADIEVQPDERPHAGWANYVAVVVQRLTRNFPATSLGVDLLLLSDLPRAAGLSSSAALVVAIGLALIERGSLTERPEYRAAITDQIALAGYLAAVETGQGFGPLAVASGAGAHGGSEDHTAILNAKPGHVSAYRYVPVRHIGDALVSAGWRFVIAASGVSAEKTGNARDRYNRASLMTRTLLSLWNERRPHAPTLADALASAPDAAAALRDRIADEPNASDLSTRLAHFIAEDGRVPEALEAFAQTDAARLSSLSADSQADADHLLGNQIEETRTLARLARDNGAFAASSFGAGFGGSVWALVHADDAERFRREWVRAYETAYPAHGQIEAFVTRGGPPCVKLKA